MGTLGWIVLITTIAGVGGTGLGGLVSAGIKRDSDQVVSLFLSFAAGVMLAVVCFDLIADALNAGGALDSSYLWLTMGGILLGCGLVALLNLWIDRVTNHEIEHVDENHPKTADALDELIHADHYQEHKKNNSQLFVAGIIMSSAIALHNLPEGMVIGAAYAGSTASIGYGGSGLAIALVIGLHNIPEGMAVAVPLISGGMSRTRAVLLTALSGAPTILGAILGFFMGTMGPIGLALALSFASGAMLYVVFGELLPEAILMWRSKLPAFATMIGVLVGLLIIYA